MASPNAPKSSEQLIREHSKARVIKAAPRDYWSRLKERREIKDQDAIEQMVRKYR